MSLCFPLRNFAFSSHHLIAFPSFQIQRTLHCSSFNIIASTCNQFHAISFQVAQCFPVDMRADSRACSSAHVPVQMQIPKPIFESVSCYLPRQFKCLVHYNLQLQPQAAIMILFHLPVLFCYLPLHCLVTRTSTQFLSDAFQRFNAFYSLLPSILPSLQFTFQVSTHTVTLHSCACWGLLEHNSSGRDSLILASSG